MTKTAKAPKYPNIVISIDLNSPDGNAFAILSTVQKALRNAGATKEELTQYSMDSMSGDYDNLIAAQSKWVNFNV
jgi:hypothetical protein